MSSIDIFPITSGKPHFYGYYDRCPFDRTGRYHLALEVDFSDRMPRADDHAVIGMVDLQDGNRFMPITSTSAWCWQQGCMLEWWGGDPARKICFNTRTNEGFATVVRDVFSDESFALPSAAYQLSPAGDRAVCVDFARIDACRPGYGYAANAADARAARSLKDDALWLVDVPGVSVISGIRLDDLARRDPHPGDAAAQHYINHVQWNPSGSRFLFLHIVNLPGGGEYTRLYTAARDGGDLNVVYEHACVSHYDWMDDEHLLVSVQLGDDPRMRFCLFNSASGDYVVIGEQEMQVDGHCSFSPDRQWLLNDTYPAGDPPQRALYLYRMPNGPRVDVARLGLSDGTRSGPMRCDLHPRWDRNGTVVSLDSIHEGTRQIYLADVAALVAASGAYVEDD